jgi:acetylornithine deacetylase
MKSGVAAMIAAAGVLAARWPRGRLIVAAVVDEEHMSLGAEALVKDWRADMAIVTEPTDLRVASGTRDLRGPRSRRMAVPRTAAGRPRDVMRSR